MAKRTNHLKQFWIDALRSGEFIQGEGFLHVQSPNRYCCLGVLAECMGIPRILHKDVTGRSCYRYAGNWVELDANTRPDWLSVKHMSHLITMNDSENKTFAEIADWIEANID